MSACSISLCPWKYNLASSSLRLFKTFSQRSHPNSEPCFLSFSFTTHYPGHVEETVFREERERERRGGGRRGRESERARGRKWVKARAKPERKRQREWMSERERECRFSLNLTTASCASNEWRGARREGDTQTRPSLLCLCEREREHNRFMSYRKSPRFVVSQNRLPRVNCMLRLLINSQFKFLCAHLSACLHVLSIHVYLFACVACARAPACVCNI